MLGGGTISTVNPLSIDRAPRTHAGSAPVSFLIDFDGTISPTDISDAILARHARGTEWKERDLRYDAGLIGSRDLLAWDATLLPDDEALLSKTATEQALDPTFTAFVEAARRWDAAIEVVSDGFGWYVSSALSRLGLDDLPVASAETMFGTGIGHPAISFPAGHPACFVCGTCKRERVREHHRRGNVVVFIGDGMSDRYGAAHAEVIFAKGRLARLCDEEGWPYAPWTTFAEISRWTDEAFASGTLPSSKADLANARRDLVASRWPGESVAVHPEERHFVCGPEVWGPGRHDPPAGDRETDVRQSR
jgi:2-hydroxy-3-keto-5-methylthiopentenyl-1-phosphate phosphatase